MIVNIKFEHVINYLVVLCFNAKQATKSVITIKKVLTNVLFLLL